MPQANGQKHLRRVLDFGLDPAGVAERDARIPRTLADIAALIVDEAEIARHGRWGGAPALNTGESIAPTFPDYGARNPQ